MKLNLLLFTFLFFGFYNCDKDSKPESEEVPLDGRGGGVIAYCYQPLQNGIHQIYIMNGDGTANKKMVEADIGLNHHDWSPNGEKLAAVGYVDQSTWSIYVFDADGSNLNRLTTTIDVNDSEPNWSPDGSQIVFSRIYPDQDHKSEIWIMDSDGSNQRFTGIDGFCAKWSPDGTRFVFQSSLMDVSDIYICKVDGTEIQQLTSTSFNEINPTFSPDGTKIAYTTDSDGNHEIYVMNTDGTNSSRLTNHQYHDYTPRWSPDGSLIAFDSGPDRQWEVHIIYADGSDLHQITDSPSGITAINPVWRPN